MEMSQQDVGREEKKGGDGEDGANAYAITECLKLQYHLMQEYDSLRDAFSNNVRYLKQTLNFLNEDSNSI